MLPLLDTGRPDGGCHRRRNGAVPASASTGFCLRARAGGKGNTELGRPLGCCAARAAAYLPPPRAGAAVCADQLLAADPGVRHMLSLPHAATV